MHPSAKPLFTCTSYCKQAAWPPTASQPGSLEALPGSETPHLRGAGDLLGWETPGLFHPWMRNQEQDSPGGFIQVSPKQTTCPLKRHFKQHLLGKGNTQFKKKQNKPQNLH